MSRKPENQFVSGVHRYLPPLEPGVHHREKMSNPYSSGTADWYYSAKNDLWVEWKYIKKLPARAPVVPDLTPLQTRWLRGRWAEGRNVWVIVGSPDGGVVLEHCDWESPMPVNEFRKQILDREQLAARINKFLTA